MGTINDLTTQIEEISAQIDAGLRRADLFYRRGKLYWKCGRRGEAMTDFNTAVSIDPASPAAAYLAMTTEIMDFYNTDLYNP